MRVKKAIFYTFTIHRLKNYLNVMKSFEDKRCHLNKLMFSVVRFL